MTANNLYENWELDRLSDFIVDTHHVFVRTNIPMIKEIGQRMTKVHGEQHPELFEIAAIFDKLAIALEEHMAGEEKYLFPYIKKLLKAHREGIKLPKPGFGTIETPLQHHYEDHDHASQMMAEIRKLSHDFSLPADACGTYTSYYTQLTAFEADLKQHIFVENEVLFGKSIQLEREVVE